MDSVTDSWQHLLPILKISPLREMTELARTARARRPGLNHKDRTSRKCPAPRWLKQHPQHVHTWLPPPQFSKVPMPGDYIHLAPTLLSNAGYDHQRVG